MIPPRRRRRPFVVRGAPCGVPVRGSWFV